MPYVTSIERVTRVQTSKEMILEYISTRFKAVPEDVAAAVNSIRAGDMLKSLFRQAITCESLDDFRKTLLTAQGGQSEA